MYQEKDNILPAMKAIAKTIASYLPVLGFALSFYDEKKSQVVQRKICRLEEFYQSLSDRLQIIEGKMNDDYINKDDFGDIFEQTANYIMNERIKDKRRCFQNIFLNSITANSCSYDKTEKYMRMLDSMGWLELKVLGVLNNPSKYNEERGNIIKDPNEGNYYLGIGLSGQNSVDLLVQLLEENKEEIMDALYYLENNRLITEQSNAIRTQSVGNPIHLLDNILTPKGKDFVCYIMRD